MLEKSLETKIRLRYLSKLGFAREMLKVTLIWIIHIVHHVHSVFSGNNPKRTGLCNQSSFYAETLNVNTALKSVSLVTSLSERSTIVTSPIMPKGVERSAGKHSGIMT